MKRVTQHDIAKALGVSQATVGLVVGRTVSGRGKEKLRPETIDLIAQKAKEMGYRPHKQAQVMRQGKTMVVGMIHAGGMLQVTNERAYYVAQALKQRGYQLLTFDIFHQDTMDDIINHLIDSSVDGVVLACTTISEHIAPLIERGVPLIGISSDDIPGIPQVRCDMYDGFEKLVNHLIEQGCRRLVHLNLSTDPNTAPEKWRWQMSTQALGFQSGLHAAGGEWSAVSLEGYRDWLQKASGDSSISGVTLCYESLKRERYNPYLPGVDLVKKLLDISPLLPDAILCQNDDWAFGMANTFLHNGIKIPKDLAITGFNDSALAEAFFVPITTVRQPTEKMAGKAVELLIDAMNGTRQTGEIFDLRGDLVVRESSLKAGTRAKKPSRNRILASA